MTGEGLEEFVAVVEAGSVTGAANLLDVPRPTVSRRLARLEERLGVRLLHRTTRRLALSEHGAALYPKARRAVEAAAEAEAHVRRIDGVPRGLLRMSIPTGAPQEAIATWMAEFLALYPEVRIELVATSRNVDLVGDGFDVVLRAGIIEDESLIARLIVRNQLIAVASPAYLAAHGTPTCPADLAAHNCIHSYSGRGVPDRRWPLLDGGTVAVSGTFATNQMTMRLQMALQGVGIALLVGPTAAESLAGGALVQVLADSVGRVEPVHLVYADREFVDAKVRAMVDFLSGRIQMSRAQRAAQGS